MTFIVIGVGAMIGDAGVGGPPAEDAGDGSERRVAVLCAVRWMCREVRSCEFLLHCRLNWNSCWTFRGYPCRHRGRS